MGLQQSKDELLYQQVNSCNIEGIKALRSQGAGLEWTYHQGKTPLILACMNPDLYEVAKTLIELGANVDAYRRGPQAGTPLHHAAKRGLDHTVKLLLSHGANPLIINDDCQTPLDIARARGYSSLVRAIEGHLCLFSGWLRELFGPSFLEFVAPQLLSRKVWVVILPCGSRNLRKPFKLELAIYDSAEKAQPRTIIPLWKANLDEQSLNQSEPVAIISNISKMSPHWKRRRCIKSFQEALCSRVRFVPAHESDKQQLQQFCDACKGIPQVMHTSYPFNNQAPAARATWPPSSEDEEVAMNPSPSPVPSAPIVDAVASNGPIQYPPIDVVAPIESSSSSAGAISVPAASSCTICLDAPLEGACVPCGHMAGCMSCMNEIKAKKWGCPVCRANIDQVIRIYAV